MVTVQEYEQQLQQRRQQIEQAQQQAEAQKLRLSQTQLRNQTIQQRQKAIQQFQEQKQTALQKIQQETSKQAQLEKEFEPVKREFEAAKQEAREWEIARKLVSEGKTYAARGAPAIMSKIRQLKEGRTVITTKTKPSEVYIDGLGYTVKPEYQEEFIQKMTGQTAAEKRLQDILASSQMSIKEGALKP